MRSSQKTRSERRFQITLMVAGAVVCTSLGFFASQLLQAHEQSSRKQALVRLTSSAVRNDLNYTVRLTEGLRDNMLKGKFLADASFFRQLYRPSVVLPDSMDFGLFKPSVVEALDEYRRRLTECEAKRQECIRTLEESDSKNDELTLLTYLISLDSVVATGVHLSQQIQADYRELPNLDTQIASYKPLQHFIGELQKNVNEAVSRRLNEQAAQRQ